MKKKLYSIEIGLLQEVYDKAESDYVKNKLERAYPDLLTSHKIGDRYLVKGSWLINPNQEYVLCQVLPLQVCLVGLESGNRLMNPVLVKDVFKITHKELGYMTGGNEETGDDEYDLVKIKTK
jgi:hypothetical protein